MTPLQCIHINIVVLGASAVQPPRVRAVCVLVPVCQTSEGMDPQHSFYWKSHYFTTHSSSSCPHPPLTPPSPPRRPAASIISPPFRVLPPSRALLDFSLLVAFEKFAFFVFVFVFQDIKGSRPRAMDMHYEMPNASSSAGTRGDSGLPTSAFFCIVGSACRGRKHAPGSTRRVPAVYCRHGDLQYVVNDLTATTVLILLYC